MNRPNSLLEVVKSEIEPNERTSKMSRTKAVSGVETVVFPPEAPALTPEERENQLINLAINRAEEQLRNGTASSQVIVHYLRLGSSKEQLEKELLTTQNELLKAKTEALESAKRVEELYSNALDAMKLYGGSH